MHLKQKKILLLVLLLCISCKYTYAIWPGSPFIQSKKTIQKPSVPYKKMAIIANLDLPVFNQFVKLSQKKSKKYKVEVHSLTDEISFNPPPSFSQINRKLKSKNISAVVIFQKDTVRVQKEKKSFVYEPSHVEVTYPLDCSVKILGDCSVSIKAEKVEEKKIEYFQDIITLKYKVSIYDVRLAKTVWTSSMELSENAIYYKNKPANVMSRFMKKTLSELKKDGYL